MKMKKLVAAALISCLALVSLAGCGGDKKDGDKAAEASNKIVVGTNAAFAPFEFQDDKGNLEGFDIDLMKEIAADQGMEAEFKNMDFDALTGALATGDIDAIAAGMSITPERLEKVSFSNPYMDASVGIVVAESNNTINDVKDLKGKLVCSQIGTVGAEICDQLKEKGIVKDVKILSDFNVCMQDIKTGGSDACIYDMPVNLLYQKKHPGEIKILKHLFTADYYAVAMAKDNKELVEKVNTGLKNLIANGKYEELCKKYELPVPENIVKGEVTVEKALELNKQAAKDNE